MKTRYPKLLSPLQVGNVTLKNRIITGPMSIVELDPKGGYTEQGIAFYEGLAAGGAALITLGESIVASDNGMTHLQQIRFDNPDVPFSLQSIADAVHPTTHSSASRSATAVPWPTRFTTTASRPWDPPAMWTNGETPSGR